MNPSHPTLVSAAEGLDAETVVLARERAASAPASPFGSITTRHKRIAVLAREGASDDAIAETVGVEPGAVARLRRSPAFRELVAKVGQT